MSTESAPEPPTSPPDPPALPAPPVTEPAAVSPPPPAPAGEATPRRTFLARATSVAMAGSLASSYGCFAAMAGRFLYPAEDAPRAWLFVADVAGFRSGTSVSYTAPDGATVAIARRGETGQVSDFVALSSTCPHLGCKVHWEAAQSRFFCPCHNGAFDPDGKATAGPPLEAGQSLGRYPLKVEAALLYIEVPTERLPGGTEPG